MTTYRFVGGPLDGQTIDDPEGDGLVVPILPTTRLLPLDELLGDPANWELDPWEHVPVPKRPKFDRFVYVIDHAARELRPEGT